MGRPKADLEIRFQKLRPLGDHTGNKLKANQFASEDALASSLWMYAQELSGDSMTMNLAAGLQALSRPGREIPSSSLQNLG